MADAQNTITIHFGAKGDKDVISAINKLDASTKKLIQTQAKLSKEGKNQIRQHTKSQKAMISLDVRLKAVGKRFSDVGISTDTLTKAYRGNRVEILKVSTATNNYIKTLNRKKKGLLDTEHSTRILGGSFAVLRSKMLLASFGAGLFSMSIGKLTKLFGEQERAEKKLETAIGRHSRALLAFASAQQKVTTFGDEEIINAMSLAGAYTDNEKAIARITQASMDLAKAKGMDLNSAIDLVSKSIFSSTNALSRYGIEVKGTTGSTERLENATNNISNLYGGQAKADAETFLGAMSQLGNAVGDTGEVFGEVLAPAVLITTKGIQAFAENIDSEKVKAYGTALILASGGYLVFSGAALKATKAVILFTKASKKNIAILAAMLIVGKLIDEFDLFSDGSGKLSEELEKLEGELEKLNSKGVATAFVFDTLTLAEIKLADVYAHQTTLFQQHSQNHEKLRQIRLSLIDAEGKLGLRYGATADEFRAAIGSNKELLEQYLLLEAEHLELEREMAKERVKLALDSAGSIVSAWSAMTGSLKSELKSREQAELDTLKNTEKYKNASNEEQKRMEKDVTGSFAQEKLKIWKMEKAASISQIMMNTASAVMKAYSQLGAYGLPVATLIAGMGAVQLKAAMDAKPPSFERGGLIGGRRHSQGGTMIEAEQGEFVMSRRAVQSVGAEALNQINQGGGAGLTVNVSAPLVDETILDTIIPAIQKAQRMNLA